MKLITHNMLSCHIKGVANGFPFKIEAEKVHLVTQSLAYTLQHRLTLVHTGGVL